MRRESSRKRLALEAAYGKHWQLVAEEWERRPMSLDEIAAAWTEAVAADYPGIGYRKWDVSRILSLARQLRAGTGCEERG